MGILSTTRLLVVAGCCTVGLSACQTTGNAQKNGDNQPSALAQLWHGFLSTDATIDRSTSDTYDIDHVWHQIENDIEQELADGKSPPSDLFANTPNAETHLPSYITQPQDLRLSTTEKLKIQAIESDDLWSDIRQGFQLQNHQNHSAVEKYKRYFTQHKAFIQKSMQRSQPYLYYIVQEVKKRGMPTEIALLPIIESNFATKAKSHKGATGIWQFTASTGKIYGLKQNWWYDGRQDVIASTNAALDYLVYLHKINGGDWLKALASYNGGYTRVNRAVKKNREAGKPSDFWHLQLNQETRQYIPRLLAVSYIVGNAPYLDFQLPTIANEPVLELVSLDRQVDLRMAATIANMTTDELYQYNHGYFRVATPPDGPFDLLMPVKNAATFRQKIASGADIFNVEWRRHTVQTGDTISELAQLYHTNGKAIATVNNLKNHHIYPGQTLMIPYAINLGEDIPQQPTATTDPQNKPLIYAVKPGDTLGEIALHHGVAIDDLMTWNQLKPHQTIRIGQELIIKNAKSVKKIQYTVKPNDSLWLIARQHDLHMEDILRWNPQYKRSRTQLQPKDQLVLWIEQPYREYTVTSGDNLWLIARKHNTRVKALAELNGLKADQPLQLGQILHIPR